MKYVFYLTLRNTACRENKKKLIGRHVTVIYIGSQ